MKWYLGMATALLFLLAAFLAGELVYESATAPLGQVGVEALTFQDSLLWPGCLALATLVGIASAALVSELSRRKGNKVRIVDVSRVAFSSAQFWQSVVLSPLVILLVFQQLRGIDDLLIAFLLAYQNGFFCRQVFDAWAAAARQPSGG
jgi:hypothetical protein